VLWCVLIAIRLFRLARVSPREMETQLRYGNWIRKKNLLILGLCTLGVGALIFVPLGPLYRLMVAILFMITLASFLFPLYAYLMFSPRGGGFQDRVYTLIVQSLGPKVIGNLLDIGSGNGVLAVKLAQHHPELEVVGIDHWGKDWEYSKKVCEENAQLIHVESRVHFQKGDAAALDFRDDTFDGVVSNLTFHEVKSAADKRDVVREALRVAKPEAAFAFVDYFYEKKYYGSASEFEGYLRRLNLLQFELQPLQYVMVIPVLLRHPKILGKVGILYGRK
jgi:ubiquinone/menaquinone biosynthesis C-methylase UbiE